MLSPIVSSTLQATAIASLSNILAQLLSQYNKNAPPTISAPEFLRFVIFTLLTAPPNFCWQVLLERTFPGRKPVHPNPKTALPRYEIHEQTGLVDEDAQDEMPETKLDWKNTMIKWFVDCMTMGALLNTTAFLVIMGLLKNRTWAEISIALRTNLGYNKLFYSQETFPIIFASYKIWPLVSVVNFALVPVEKRIVFLSAVGLLWGIYLSLTAAKQ